MHSLLWGRTLDGAVVDPVSCSGVMESVDETKVVTTVSCTTRDSTVYRMKKTLAVLEAGVMSPYPIVRNVSTAK